jgi:hypothetical protein
MERKAYRNGVSYSPPQDRGRPDRVGVAHTRLYPGKARAAPASRPQEGRRRAVVVAAQPRCHRAGMGCIHRGIGAAHSHRRDPVGIGRNRRSAGAAHNPPEAPGSRNRLPEVGCRSWKGAVARMRAAPPGEGTATRPAYAHSPRPGHLRKGLMGRQRPQMERGYRGRQEAGPLWCPRADIVQGWAQGWVVDTRAQRRAAAAPRVLSNVSSGPAPQHRRMVSSHTRWRPLAPHPTVARGLPMAGHSPKGGNRHPRRSLRDRVAHIRAWTVGHHRAAAAGIPLGSPPCPRPRPARQTAPRADSAPPPLQAGPCASP